jgi:NTP pyrophosphatase (non-canonical NTP hydrolase)
MPCITPMIGTSDMPQVKPLNAKQHEICEILSEECAEIIQAASKMKRCGADFIPTESILTARQQFSAELADAMRLIDEAVVSGLVDLDYLREVYYRKPEKLRKWTKYLGNAPSCFSVHLPQASPDNLP